jgi:SET domain-containing protein
VIDNAPDCYVMSSRVHGMGLYAGKDFKKGEVIVDMTPYRKEFYKIRYDELNEYQISRNWYVQVDDEYCVTFDRFSKFAYLNHSRSPSADWLIEEYLIIAKKDIKHDEEITIDYRVEQRPTRKNWPDWI